MPKVVDSGFIKGDGANLPVVDTVTLAVFMNSTVLEPEMRNVKTQRSARTSYGDQAVGYVQLRREGSLCIVKGEVTPEHRVRSKAYNVQCHVNEESNQIIKAFCDDCPASAGCCKHTVAFVHWLHRRSEEPSCTSVPCYWLKSKLGGVGTKVKTLFVAEMLSGEKPVEDDREEEGPNFFFNAVSALYGSSGGPSLLSKHLSPTPSLSIINLLLDHRETIGPHTGEGFIKFCSTQMNENICSILAEKTQDQSSSKLWFSLRHGRITASKFYEAARCQTADGALVNGILGARKIKDTAAMARGRTLEPEVLEVVKSTYSRKPRRTGLVLKKEYPIFGASPDGVFEDTVIEVKCPSSNNRYKDYFTKDFSAPSRKYDAQIQLQMFLCDKNRGLFCVASPDFETSKCVKIVQVSLNENYVLSLLKNATSFWLSNIYPKLCHSLQV